MSSNDCNETKTTTDTETKIDSSECMFFEHSYSQDETLIVEKSYISMAFDIERTCSATATYESDFPPFSSLSSAVTSSTQPPPPPPPPAMSSLEGAIVNPGLKIMEMPLIMSTSSNSIPPTLPPRPFVVEPTHYHINKSIPVSTVISTIVQALVKYKVGLVSFSAYAYKMKCYYEYTNPNLKAILPEDITDQATTRTSFMIKIFSLPKDTVSDQDSSNYNMVEFQRRSGDGSTFCQLYDKISAELDSVGFIDHSVPRSSQSFHQFKPRQRQIQIPIECDA